MTAILEAQDETMTPRARPLSRACLQKIFRLLLPVVLIAVTTTAYGLRRTPANPVRPLVLNGADRLEQFTERSTLRVATFNIHAGVGRDHVCDLERTARYLQDVDIVALQEIRGNLLGLRETQVKVVGDKLDMASMFIPTEWSMWHNHYGNGLLTRVPLQGYQCIPLIGTQHRRFRNALLARFQFDGETVHLLATHIDSTRDREAQLKAIVDLYLSLAEPSILMGDLNARPEHQQLQRLLAAPGVCNAMQGCSREGVLKPPIDWIVTRGFETVDAKWVETDASDHPLVRAELELVQRR